MDIFKAKTAYGDKITLIGNVPVENTSWQNISNGNDKVTSFTISKTAYNVTLEFNYLPESAYNFYSPILINNIDVTSWSGYYPSVNITYPLNITYYIIAPAVINYTKNVIYLEDGEMG
jgi:hypothetical protein